MGCAQWPNYSRLTKAYWSLNSKRIQLSLGQKEQNKPSLLCLRLALSYRLLNTKELESSAKEATTMTSSTKLNSTQIKRNTNISREKSMSIGSMTVSLKACLKGCLNTLRRMRLRKRWKSPKISKYSLKRDLLSSFLYTCSKIFPNRRRKLMFIIQRTHTMKFDNY